MPFLFQPDSHISAPAGFIRQRRQHLTIDIIVAKCGRVLFEPQPAQPRHYVHAVILAPRSGSPLTEKHIPLPVGVPSAALK